MGDLSALAGRINGTTLAWINGAMYLAIAIGLAMAITGVIHLVNKQISSGLKLFFAGILLTSLTQGFLPTGSETLFGGNQTESVFSTMKH